VELSNVDPGTLSVVLALVASTLFGMTVLTGKRGLETVDPETGSLIILTAATVVFWVSSPLWIKPENLFTAGFWVFCLNGLLHPMLSMYCALQATLRTHASVAATLTATAPLFAAAGAVVLLDEAVTLPVAIGTLATVIGVGILSWVPEGMRKLMFAALAFATVTAAVRGLTQSTGKVGLNLTFDPPLAGAVSFTVSALGTALIYRARRGHLPSRASVSMTGLKWFVITGSVNSIAIFCMYFALAYGRVTVIAPIVAASPVFTILFGRLIFGERLGSKTLFGIGLVIAGVIALSTAR